MLDMSTSAAFTTRFAPSDQASVRDERGSHLIVDGAFLRQVSLHLRDLEHAEDCWQPRVLAKAIEIAGKRNGIRRPGARTLVHQEFSPFVCRMGHEYAKDGFRVFNVPYQGGVGEKGVDVEFALQCLTLGLGHPGATILLLTGDGDFAPVADRLVALGCRPLLLTTRLDPYGALPGVCYSRALSSSCGATIDIGPCLVEASAWFRRAGGTR